MDRLNRLILEALGQGKVYPKVPTEALGYLDFSSNPEDPELHIKEYAVVRMSTLAKTIAQDMKSLADRIAVDPVMVFDNLVPATGKNLPNLTYKLKAMAEAKALMATPLAKRTITMLSRRV
jgi:hypothetical protein